MKTIKSILSNTFPTVRKLLAVLIVAGVATTAVFADGVVHVRDHKGMEYTSAAEIISNNIPTLVNDWDSSGYGTPTIKITEYPFESFIELKDIPADVVAAIKDDYAYAHTHKYGLLLDEPFDLEDGTYDWYFVDRVAAYRLQDGNVLVVEAYTDYFEPISK